jgi:hypothetical protein
MNSIYIPGHRPHSPQNSTLHLFTRLNKKIAKEDDKKMKKTLCIVFVMSFVLLPLIVSAHTADDPYWTDLIAGGGGKGSGAMDAGDVLIWNNADNLYVKYVVDAPWCITETHLQVTTSFNGIPQTKGNPVPGHFDYSGMHECVPEVVYTIPLDDWTLGTELVIAAHAVVAQEVVVDDSSYMQYATAWGAGYVFPGKTWATYFNYEVQSEPTCNPAIDIEKRTNGNAVAVPPGPALTVGEAITWTYVVTNTGDVILETVVVTDDQGVSVSCPKTTLDPGESMTCTAFGYATGGQYVNIGTATGSGCGTSVTDSDTSYYFGEVPPPECAHDLCVTGEALVATCDSCVATVCATDPWCCANTWDGFCIEEAVDWCVGISCPSATCAVAPSVFCGGGAPAGCSCDLSCCEAGNCCPDAQSGCGFVCGD